jgi:signal transduction histidine kinase
LFDRFYQVDKARTRQNDENAPEGDQKPSGTGLGLSIAQWIARAHGGVINLQSELGQGSIFEASLPLADLLPDSMSEE